MHQYTHHQINPHRLTDQAHPTQNTQTQGGGIPAALPPDLPNNESPPTAAVVPTAAAGSNKEVDRHERWSAVVAFD